MKKAQKKYYKEEKILYLEGLRGIAAFIVVLYHLAYGFYPALLYPTQNKTLTALSGTPINLFYNGHFAVYIFFVLSGFVLTYKFFKNKDYKIIQSSASRRYFRLLMPVLFSVFTVFIMMKLSLFFNQESSKTTTCCLETYFSFKPNILEMLYHSFIVPFFVGSTKYNIVLWTIKYEFFGSFLVFATCALFYSLKRRYIFYIAIFILIINTPYSAFILGAALSDLANSNPRILIKLSKIYIVVPILLLSLFLGSYPNNRIVSDTIYSGMKLSFMKDPAHLYHMAGAFLMLLSVLLSNHLKLLLTTTFPLFLGKISFSMYVIHFVIINSFSSFIFINLIHRVPYNITFLITSATSVIFIFAISYLIYKYIDLMGIRLSKLIYNKFFN